jgi:hypothetical protein
MSPREYDRFNPPFRIVMRPGGDDGYDLIGPNNMIWRWSRTNYGELMDYKEKFNLVYELGYFDGLNHREEYEHGA